MAVGVPRVEPPIGKYSDRALPWVRKFMARTVTFVDLPEWLEEEGLGL